MKKAGETYNNGQDVSEQKGDVLTYYFENGEVKAQGKYVDGVMQGKWIFSKKEGYFDDAGKQHGQWTVLNKDGSVQKKNNLTTGGYSRVVNHWHLKFREIVGC